MRLRGHRRSFYHEVAVDPVRPAVLVLVGDRGPFGLQVVQADVPHLEPGVAAVVGVVRDQVRDEVLLRVDEMALAGQLAVPHDVAHPVDAELEGVLRLCPLEQPVGEAVAFEGAHRPLLDEPGPRPAAR